MSYWTSPEYGEATAIFDGNLELSCKQLQSKTFDGGTCQSKTDLGQRELGVRFGLIEIVLGNFLSKSGEPF